MRGFLFSALARARQQEVLLDAVVVEVEAHELLELGAERGQFRGIGAA